MHKKTLTTLLCTLLLSSTACAQRRGAAADAAPTPAAQQATANPAPSATCRLLSAADISAAQGEEPSDAQGTEHLLDGLSMSQCLYRLPTFTKSVVLEVTRATPGAPAGAVREFWRKRFGPDAIKERQREQGLREELKRQREEDLKRAQESGQSREGGRKRKEPKAGVETTPQRVPGVGDEAYWTGNRMTVTFSALKKDAAISLTVGGPEEHSVKVRKAAELASKVLKQL